MGQVFVALLGDPLGFSHQSSAGSYVASASEPVLFCKGLHEEIVSSNGVGGNARLQCGTIH